MRTVNRIVVVAALAAVLGTCIVASTGRAQSAAEAKQMGFDAKKTMAENLAPMVGQVVTVRLASGQSLSGKVDAVGGHVVHLGTLTGKDYFDALVRLDAIEAVEARMRK